jgi:hypothetical protein
VAVGKSRVITPERWQELVPDFKQSRASVGGEYVLFTVEVEIAHTVADKAPAGWSRPALVRWYKNEYVPACMARSETPKREKDVEAARKHFGCDIPIKAVYGVRAESAPGEWTRKGRRPEHG